MHSSTSMAIRFRNSIVVGFIRISPREIVGNSRGKPPAESTPRFTASATWRRWALQLVSSDHELAMPMTGRPSNMWSLKPSALIHERWTRPSRSERPNQLRLRSAVVIGEPPVLVRLGMGGASDPASQWDPAQAKGVGDDGHRAETHGRARDHRAQEEARERIEHPGRHRDAEHVVDEGPDKVLADVAHRRAGEAPGEK